MTAKSVKLILDFEHTSSTFIQSIHITTCLISTREYGYDASIGQVAIHQGEIYASQQHFF